MASMESRKRMGEVDGRWDPKKPRGDEPLVKMLIPNGLCGFLIGKGGSGLKELRTTYGGFVSFSGAEEFYPGTEEQICLLKGSIQQITDLTYQMMERMTQHEDKRTRIVLTSKCAGLIIGKGGANVKQIQGQSGARLSVSDGFEGAERIVTIMGTLEQRAEAMNQIIARTAVDPTNMANVQMKYETGMNKGMAAMGGPPAPFKEQLKQHLVSAIMGEPVPPPQHTSGGRAPRLNPLPTNIQMVIDVPFHMVGYIMGNRGSGVKDIMRHTGAKLEFNKYSDKEETGNRGMRKLTVTGNLDQTTMAHELVHDKVDEFMAGRPSQFTSKSW